MCVCVCGIFRYLPFLWTCRKSVWEKERVSASECRICTCENVWKIRRRKWVAAEKRQIDRDMWIANDGKGDRGASVMGGVVGRPLCEWRKACLKHGDTTKERESECIRVREIEWAKESGTGSKQGKCNRNMCKYEHQIHRHYGVVANPSMPFHPTTPEPSEPVSQPAKQQSISGGSNRDNGGDSSSISISSNANASHR